MVKSFHHVKVIAQLALPHLFSGAARAFHQGAWSRVSRFPNYRMLTGRPWQRLGVGDGRVAIDTPQGRASRGSATEDCRGSAHKRARGSAAKDTGTLDQSAERKLATTVLPLRSILIDRWRRTDEDARQARTGSPQRTQVRKLIVAPRREHSRDRKSTL